MARDTKTAMYCDCISSMELLAYHKSDAAVLTRLEP